MSVANRLLALSALTFSLAPLAGAAPSARADKTAIRALERGFVTAFEAKNVPRIMAYFMPGSSLLVYDYFTPLQFSGHTAYTKDWQDFVKLVKGPLDVKLSQVVIKTNGSDLAYGHYINRTTGTLTSGMPIDIVTRITHVYRKVDGKWLIVHEHVSVPIDLSKGKPDYQAKP